VVIGPLGKPRRQGVNVKKNELSSLVGKTIIDRISGRTGLVVEGYKVHNEDSPYTDVILALYSTGEKEVHMESRCTEERDFTIIEPGGVTANETP